MRHFVVIGRSADAAGTFLLDDLPGTSGRLDVLLRCVRAALLTSHGLRRDVRVDLVLLGGPRAPRTLRIDGASAKFVRPDERALATLVKKSLTAVPAEATTPFVEVRPGIAIAEDGLAAVLGELAGPALYVLEESGEEIRDVELARDAVFFLGDHLGFDPSTRAELAVIGVRALRVGPTSLHSDDVVSIVSNEMDRRHGV